MSQGQQAVVVVTQIITLSASFRYNREITNDLSKRPFFHTVQAGRIKRGWRAPKGWNFKEGCIKMGIH